MNIEKMPESELLGKKVKTKVELRNGNSIIPIGSILTIHRKWSGLGLTSDECKCCGVRVFINKVPCSDVELT